MQTILPIFPDETKMVNFQVGFKQMDDFVHYFVNGMPVYCHEAVFPGTNLKLCFKTATL